MTFNHQTYCWSVPFIPFHSVQHNTVIFRLYIKYHNIVDVLVSYLEREEVGFMQIWAPQSCIWLFNMPFDYQTLLTKIIIMYSICLGNVSDIPVFCVWPNVLWHNIYAEMGSASLGRDTELPLCPVGVNNNEVVHLNCQETRRGTI